MANNHDTMKSVSIIPHTPDVTRQHEAAGDPLPWLGEGLYEAQFPKSLTGHGRTKRSALSRLASEMASIAATLRQESLVPLDAAPTTLKLARWGDDLVCYNGIVLIGEGPWRVSIDRYHGDWDNLPWEHEVTGDDAPVLVTIGQESRWLVPEGWLREVGSTVVEVPAWPAPAPEDAEK